MSRVLNQNSMPNKVLVFLSTKIREKRKELGLTQQQLADCVGLSRVQIVNIEMCKNGTTYEGVYNLCCAFNCEISELFPPIVAVERRTVVIERTVLIPTKHKINKLELSKVKRARK